MKAVILKCKPNAMFHLGKIAIDEDTSLNETSEIIHSDTLFSALVNIYDKVFEDTDAFVQLFRDNKVRISSCFYCLEISKNDYTYFFPKPVSYSLANLEDYKKTKKIQFISVGVWKMGIHPEKFTESPCVIIDKKFVCLSELEVKKWEDVKVYSVIDLPKTAVHKATKEDAFYYQTNIQIADNGDLGVKPHFYFLWDDNGLTTDERSKFITCLELLVDTGIGGERSTGCGHLDEIKIVEDFPKIQFDNPLEYASLSLISPKDQEALSQIKYYKTITRGGRRLGKQDSKKYLNQVRMVAEGAVLNSDSLQGDLADVSPNEDESFLRYGIPLLFPIHPNLKILKLCKKN